MCFWLLCVPFVYALDDAQVNRPAREGAPEVQRVTIAPPNTTWEMVKTCVHIAALLTSIAGGGISAYMMSVYFQNPAVSSIVGIIGLPVLLLTFLWNAFEIIARSRNRWRTGMRPAAHLAMGLIISIIAIWIGISLVMSTSRMPSSCDTFGAGVFDSCDHSGPRIDPAMPPAVAAFVILNAAFHLFIFVAGCVDVHRRNKYNKKLDANAAAAAAATNQPQEAGGRGGVEMEAAQTGVTAAAPALQAPMAAGSASVYSLQEYYAPAHAEHSAV